MGVVSYGGHVPRGIPLSLGDAHQVRRIDHRAHGRIRIRFGVERIQLSLDERLRFGIRCVEAGKPILPKFPVSEDALYNIADHRCLRHAALAAKGASAKLGLIR